ncbi:MAG: hypothetical protein SFY80_17865 [Verrucomicrobiota bacterium]|nr:hypothetical protein [Verrucomicrobiota bacterium]
MPYSAIQLLHGRPTLFISGKPVAPHIYALTDVPGGRWSWEELPAHGLRQFARAGFRLFQADLAMDFYWTAPGCYDLSLAVRQIRGIQDACPTASIMLRLHVRPPRWWMLAHPEENTVYLDTKAEADYAGGLQRIIEDDPRAPSRTSLASQRWLDEVGPVVQQFCETLSATPEGQSIFGIQVAGGVYGEWHYWGFNTHEVDAGIPMRDRFRAWLQDKYKTDSNLQTAWNDSQATLAAATVPGFEARKATKDGLFRDPRNERVLIDYTTCQHEAVARAIEYFARTVKTAWPNPIIAGAFYGYFFSVFGREVAGGHLALQKLLKSPWIDFLCGPAAYYPGAVEVGDVHRSRSLLLSLRLNGKLWLDEMDQQSPIAGPTHPEYQSCITESIAKTRRNFISSHVHGAGLWFYDFGPSGFSMRAITQRFLRGDSGSAGWWEDPQLLADIAKTRTLLESLLRKDNEPVADVLVVGDTISLHYTASLIGANPVDHAGINWTPLGIYRAGVALDTVHLDDLNKVNLEQYKVVVFLNCHLMLPGQRAWIRENVAQNGRHLIWFYAPGYTDGISNQAAHIADVTQMAVSRITLEGKAEIQGVDKHFPSLRYGVTDSVLTPIFAVDDSTAETLAIYVGDGRTAWARKSFSSHTAWYVALPAWDERVTTNLIIKTPAHRYTTDGSIAYAGEGLLAIHTKTGGRIEVTLRNGKIIKLELPAGPYTAFLNPMTGEEF